MHKIIITILICFFSQISYIHANIDKANFWLTQKRGANIFNININRSDIRAAKEYGINFLRIAPDKFKSSSKDFLIGSADNYTSINTIDLDNLKKILDICYLENMPVIITMLSLPGSRWKQNNSNKDDIRIWQDPKYLKMSVKFWGEFAKEVASHPAIIGLNILNEPHPEQALHNTNLKDEELNAKANKKMHEFNDAIIAAIRAHNKNVAIILDSANYADPAFFKFLTPHNDPKVIYSFHMYEPYAYTNRKLNKNKVHYPGTIENIYWDKKALRGILKAVNDFQNKYNIPSNRILVGEFGVNRMNPDVEKYFKDLLEIFDENGWHHAFYAFRQDDWPGMDYELGKKGLSLKQWEEFDQGITHNLKRDSSSKIFKTIIKSLSN